MQNIVKVDFQTKKLIEEDTYTKSSNGEPSVFKIMRDAINAEKESIIKGYLSS